MYIDKVLKTSEKKSNLNYPTIEIITKDYREFTFKFPAEQIFSSNMMNQKPFEKISLILTTCFLPKFREIYASQFAFYLKSLDDDHNGWQIYDIREEFLRQGLDIAYNPLDKEGIHLRYIDNQNGRICSTYPFILVMPSKINEESVIKCANFRSRERLPVLTFSYSQRLPNGKINKNFLWRSSQCKSGMTTQRSLDDELVLRLIGEKIVDGNSIPSFLKIFDARPYLNAMVNKIDGKGYENTTYYKNADLRFLGIHNIQKVRDAFRKLCNACYNLDDAKWFNQIESWFDLLKFILSGAMEIVDALKVFFLIK